MPKTKLTPAQIESKLDHFRGGGTPYKHNSNILIYTPGVKEMAQLCDAYWLIDVAASFQTLEVAKKEEFQVIKFAKYEDNSGQVHLTDGNDNRLHSQQIPFTDFPLDIFKMFYNNPMAQVYNDPGSRVKKYHKATLYLPSEH